MIKPPPVVGSVVVPLPGLKSTELRYVPPTITLPLPSSVTLIAADDPFVEPTVFPINGLTQPNCPFVFKFRTKPLRAAPLETFLVLGPGSKSVMPSNDPATKTLPAPFTASSAVVIIDRSLIVLDQMEAPDELNFKMSYESPSRCPPAHRRSRWHRHRLPAAESSAAFPQRFAHWTLPLGSSLATNPSSLPTLESVVEPKSAAPTNSPAT